MRFAHRADTTMWRKAAAAGLVVSLLANPVLAAGFVAQEGSKGTDYSANPPSLGGLTLIKTIPIEADRLGYLIEADCSAGLVVLVDDGTDTGNTCTAGKCSAKPVAGGASDGAQGGAMTWSGMPHTGRFRIYSSNASCQFFARTW